MILVAVTIIDIFLAGRQVIFGQRVIVVVIFRLVIVCNIASHTFADCSLVGKPVVVIGLALRTLSLVLLRFQQLQRILYFLDV